MPHVRPWRIATVLLVALASLLLSRSSVLDALTDGLEEERHPAPLRVQRLTTPTIVESTADWLDGKSIPQAMDILPKALSLQNIAQYEKDVAEAGAVYADPARRASYLKMYGNICYDTRDRYINFPWSSERK